MTRHIGAEDLARYREGDLGNRKTARIRAHLAGCPRCTALQTDLAEVTALLASAPAPAMPDQVTARIQAALMAEAASTAAGSTAAGSTATAGNMAQPETPGQTAEPGQRRHSRHAADGAAGARRRRLPELRSQLAVRALGVATAAAVVVGGVYAVSQLGGAGQTGASSSAAGSFGAPALRTPSRLSGPALRYGQAGHAASITPVSTGTNFSRQQLASQVAGALRHSAVNLPATAGPDAGTGKVTHPVPGAGPRPARSFAGLPVSALQGCLTRISAGRTVLLVDVDSYQGKPATVIVVAGGAGGTSGSRVFVVGPGCSASNSDLITGASLHRAG